MRKLILLLIIINGMYSCEMNEVVTLIKDCTGIYIRLDNKDYKICNSEKFKNIDEGSTLNLTFVRVDECDVMKEDVMCMMEHPNRGWVIIKKIN